MKLILGTIALVLLSSAVLAAGCPPGTKQQCMQSKGGGVVCSCR